MTTNLGKVARTREPVPDMATTRSFNTSKPKGISSPGSDALEQAGQFGLRQAAS